MTLPSFEAFEAEARAAGATEVLARDWPPDAVLEEHTHPFAVSALMVRGRLWLTCGGHTRELEAGDRFTLARDEPHAERYGPAGATYWVGRRA
jgi:hypothetical protein